ncbi:hypothetical protein AGMMS50262_12100 [Bacteroidia bacterium]|nr:hypothetical protein AGMMS50262_12100 [Bacteroidia bacterium]
MDSVKIDSSQIVQDTVPKKTNAIDAPVDYASQDSMIMLLDGHNMIYMYGEGSVHYKNLDFTSEYVEVDADNSALYGTFGLDSIGEEFGYPIFKEGETQYEMKQAQYNFKTKKMFVHDVITQQGEGYMTAAQTKKMPDDVLFLLNGRYTTCDKHDDPDFYLQLTKAKMRPGKNVVTGPAYLVVAGVPLPVALPFAFFPFSKKYASGIIMPTYGDEMRRGFSLREGGYYFAFNDYVDLALTGEIYTNLSWGLKGHSTYRKRYKFSGNVQAGYLVNISGDRDTKDMEGSDYSRTQSFNLTWSHTQDAKANPFGSFSASVNLTTSGYDRNDLNRLNSGAYTDNTKSSSVNYSYRPSNSPFSFTMATSINQTSRDTTLSVTLPNLTITMRDIYPFKRKEQVGAPKWYEAIRLSYNGVLQSSIQNVKEYDFFKKNYIRDWKNGMKHNVRTSATFSLLKYITITPSMDYTNRWYTTRTDKYYEPTEGILQDTIHHGFYQVYDYRASVGMNTKLYGMYKPWGIFGKWAKKTQIRHVLTPSISFSGAPDFSAPGYNYYIPVTYFDKENWAVKSTTYSPYQGQLFGVPGKGQTGAMSIGLDNNLEMKTPIAGTDSLKKISLIDGLSINTSYNFLADSLNWSNPTVNLRLKWGKFNWNVGGVFDIYQYGENGQNINKLRILNGKGFGRFMGTSTSFSYTFNNDTFKNLFKKGDKKDEGEEKTPISSENMESDDDSVETNKASQTSLRKHKEKDENYDEDGYFLLSIPWSLSLNYSIGFGYDRANFDKEKREYPYKMNQSNLGIYGSITPTKNWSFSFSTSYDVDNRKFTTMQCSVSRQMHCWSMSASIIPVGPWQSYNFTIAVNSSLLHDLKYEQSSNYRDAMNWGE